MEVVEPQYQVVSRKHLMQVLQGSYDDIKEKLKAELNEIPWLCMTSDFWTSTSVDSYLGITAHFITKEWKFRSCVLQTRELKASHTGENIEVIEEWALNGKLSGMTTDNGRNIVRAMGILGWNQLPCVEAVSRLVARCRRVVTHFRHSYKAQTALEEKQVQLNLPKHKLAQDVPTRWNSTLYMIQRLVEQQAAVSSVLMDTKRSDLRNLILTPSEITQLEQVAKVLNPLEEATTILPGEKNISISVVQPIVAGLRRRLKSSETDTVLVANMKSAILTNIQDHFSDEEKNEMMLVASALDPRFKLLKFLSVCFAH